MAAPVEHLPGWAHIPWWFEWHDMSFHSCNVVLKDDELDAFVKKSREEEWGLGDGSYRASTMIKLPKHRYLVLSEDSHCGGKIAFLEELTEKTKEYLKEHDCHDDMTYVDPYFTSVIIDTSTGGIIFSSKDYRKKRQHNPDGDTDIELPEAPFEWMGPSLAWTG